MPQFKQIRMKVINYKNIAMGLFLFTIGLFKKVILADSFAVWASQGFDQPDQLTFIEGWIVSLSYTMQIYFDFSGYMDMAMGAALLLGSTGTVPALPPIKHEYKGLSWASKEG
ncbi:hypothetical protein [Metabacillus litoralis]|uniref:hypothetical protein n=1 Tax=Metabacillus litoralis TaxID=152268 RepID=UPI001CFE79A3|nr:hypothetical protein [Metabacillus litoralis]